MKTKVTLNGIYSLVMENVRGWDFYAPLIFFTTYLLAYTTFTIIVSNVSYLKFFCFWVAMDISVGVCRAATEKIVVFKQNIEDAFLSRTYLFSMICMLTLMLLILLIKGLFV